MKHSPRTPLRVLAASLFFCGLLGTTTRAASTWRDYAVDRKPDTYFIGNQDFSTNDCIAWSSRGALLGEPVHTLGRAIPSAPAIYARATRLKSRSGEKMDTRHAAEALLDLGFIDDYETLQNPYEIWDWLKYEGPVAAAIYWDERMTNHRGTLRAIPVDRETWTTHKAHAITILGWSPKERAFVFTPNLGAGWGRKGFALLRETDFPFVFVNAVGFEHGNELNAKAIGETPPVDREKMRAAAATNLWYTAPGPMKTAKLGESTVNARVKVNVGTAMAAMAKAKAKAEVKAQAVATSKTAIPRATSAPLAVVGVKAKPATEKAKPVAALTTKAKAGPAIGKKALVRKTAAKRPAVVVLFKNREGGSVFSSRENPGKFGRKKKH